MFRGQWLFYTVSKLYNVILVLVIVLAPNSVIWPDCVKQLETCSECQKASCHAQRPDVTHFQTISPPAVALRHTNKKWCNCVKTGKIKEFKVLLFINPLHTCTIISVKWCMIVGTIGFTKLEKWIMCGTEGFRCCSTIQQAFRRVAPAVTPFRPLLKNIQCCNNYH